MRLALSIEIQEGMTYAQTLAMTLAGERLGWDSALLAEHYYPSGRQERYTEPRMSADAWIFLAGLARETTQIKLGTLVSPVTFRHPVVLAKMAATLDHLSDGRAELGLGAGWLPAEHQAYGFPFPEAPRRVDLLEEQLQVVTGLLNPETEQFTHNGSSYHLQQARFLPKPMRKLSIIVGGSSTAVRLPKLAARYADEYVINSPSLEQCQTTRERLDRECAKLDRDPATIRLSAFLAICVAESSAELDKIMQRYEADNPQYVRMTDTRPNWIYGTPEQASEQLRKLGEAGIDRALISVNDDIHLDQLPLLHV